MVIENEVPPFYEWLLGPGWPEGGLFVFGSFTVLLGLVVCLAAVAGLFYLLRKGSTRAARRVARSAIIGPLVLALVVVILAVFLAVLDAVFDSQLLKDAVNSLARASQSALGAQWYLGAVYFWALVTYCVWLAAITLGWLTATVRGGPRKGVRSVDQASAAMLIDIAVVSPRRVAALAWLAVKEAIRNKVVVVVGIFILVLMFAGWFLDSSSEEPGRLYLDFVLTASSYLILLLALFLSAFSLPNDIRKRTLHTVVTKPVRASEIVLGRIVGFTVVGTFLLIIMCVTSYAFVRLGLSHTHVLRADNLTAIGQSDEDGSTGRLEGKTHLDKSVRGHRHRVVVDSSGNPQTLTAHGHNHLITVKGSGAEAVYRLGPAQGNLMARVPIRGKLRFRNREGLDAKAGINVGDEWTYRSYIEGQTLAAAIWTFENLREEDFEEQIPVEMTLGVFRTHKGDIEKTIFGSLSVRNPSNGLSVEVEIFQSREFVPLQVRIPRTITKYSSKDVVIQKANVKGELVLTPDPRSRQVQELLVRLRRLLDEEEKLASGAAASERTWQDVLDEEALLWVELEDARPLSDFSPDRQLLAQQRELCLGAKAQPTGAEIRELIAKQRRLLLDHEQGNTPEKTEFDLFADLVQDGRVEIWLRCLEGAQHFGAAQPDLYLRAGDASVELNFIKGYFGIWLQMVMVIALGVMFSTLVSGPVAMVATAAALLGGFFRDFMVGIADKSVLGGGPAEAFHRLLTQENVMSEFDAGMATGFIQMLDTVWRGFLFVFASVLPPFAEFSCSNYVANGYNISVEFLLIRSLTAMAFLAPFFLVGYLFLRNREVAA